MLIVPLKKNSLFDLNTRLSLGTMKIGVFQGLFVITKKEQKELVEIGETIWREHLQKICPGLAKWQPSVSLILAKAIRETFGDKEIAFVAGNGVLKNYWKEIFVNDFLKCGLNLAIMTPKEILEHRPGNCVGVGVMRGVEAIPVNTSKSL